MIAKCGRKWRFRRAPLREMQWMAEIYHSTDTYTDTNTNTHTTTHTRIVFYRESSATERLIRQHAVPSDVTLSLAPCGKGEVEREATHIHKSQVTRPLARKRGAVAWKVSRFHGKSSSNSQYRYHPCKAWDCTHDHLPLIHRLLPCSELYVSLLTRGEASSCYFDGVASADILTSTAYRSSAWVVVQSVLDTTLHAAHSRL